MGDERWRKRLDDARHFLAEARYEGPGRKKGFSWPVRKLSPYKESGYKKESLWLVLKMPSSCQGRLLVLLLQVISNSQKAFVPTAKAARDFVVIGCPPY